MTTAASDLSHYVERLHAAAEYLAEEDGLADTQSRRARREIGEFLPAASEIASVLAPHLTSRFDSVDQPYSELAGAAAQLLGTLRHRDDVRRLLPPQGPSMAASGLHSRVWDAAKHRWQDDRPLDAVRAAASETEQQLKAKVGQHDRDVVHLVTQAFKTDDPVPGEARLRVRGFEPGSRTWTSVHQGAAQYGRGVFLAIRNPVAHHNTELDRQVAFEYLAALSVLARWIDEADLLIAPDV